MRERMRQRHQARLDALRQPVRIGRRLPDEPDAMAERLRLDNIGGDHFANPRDRYAFEIDRGAKGQAREDRQLVRGVDAVNVKARIGLSISKRLRFTEHIGKIATFAFHRRENIIAGAVEDPEHARNLVRGRAFAQPLDHRNAARDRGFEFERNLRGLCRRRKLKPVMRDHRLVRGNKAAPRRNAAPRERQRGTVAAANQFDDDINAFDFSKRAGVINPGEARQINAAIAVAVARRNRDHLDRAPRAAADQIAIGVEQLDHTAANGAETGNRHAQSLSHVFPQE